MSNSSPAISVIVPAYRTTEYIAETLDSVFAQTVTDFELIVVNDGCPDTVNLDRVLEPYLSRIVYVKQPNGGPGGARNTGVRTARAPIVTMLDSDDLWEPDYLEAQIARMQEDPTIDVIYADAVLFGDTPDAGKTVMQRFPHQGDGTFLTILSEQCLPGSLVMARKEALIRAGLYDSALVSAEDTDLWLRVAKAGGRIVYNARPLIRYRCRAGSQSNDPVRNLEHFIRVLEKLMKRDDLAAEEREAVAGRLAKKQAQLHFETGRKALYHGDTDTAVKHLAMANRYFRQPKAAVVVGLLRIAPRLAYWLTRFRYYPGVSHAS